MYNTGALGLITSALVSGFGNVGQQLAGLIYTGTGPKGGVRPESPAHRP